MKHIKVKNCKGCPFSESYSYNNYIGADCLHPLTQARMIDSHYKNYSSPTWCPLKKESVTIEFNKLNKK